MKNLLIALATVLALAIAPAVYAKKPGGKAHHTSPKAAKPKAGK